jgi:hypothetical protein
MNQTIRATARLGHTMTRRDKVLTMLRVAGYHDDKATWTRVYCENRVAFAAAQIAFNEGQRTKANGVKCSCFECNRVVA